MFLLSRSVALANPAGGSLAASFEEEQSDDPYAHSPAPCLQLNVNAGPTSDEDAGYDGADVAIPASLSHRAERKSRKSLQGIGLKKVAGITRVTMKRPRGVSTMELKNLERRKGCQWILLSQMDRCPAVAWHGGQRRWR